MPTLVREIQTWSNSSQVAALRIIFTNNKYMDLGSAANVPNLEFGKLDLKPSTASLAVFGATNTTTENINGFYLEVTTGDSLSAGDKTGASRSDFEKIGRPHELLAGISGHFGTNGLESIKLLLAKSIPRPAEVAVVPLPQPTNGTLTLNGTLSRSRFVI
jgi:hypothetical protein